MATATKIDFKTLKETVLLPAILQHYNLLSCFSRTEKGELKGPCPFDEAANGSVSKSFSISVDGKLWYNHDKHSKSLPVDPITQEVKRGGNILDFVMIKEKVSLRRAGELIVDMGSPSKAAIEPESSIASDGAEALSVIAVKANTVLKNPTFAERNLKPLSLNAAHNGLADLGLSIELCEAAGIGFASKGMMKGRLAFPIQNLTGELVGYGGLDISGEGKELWIYPKDFAPELEVHGLYQVGVLLDQSDNLPDDEVLVITFDLFQQARVSESHLSVCLLSPELSEAQKQALKRFSEDGRVYRYLILVSKQGEFLNAPLAIPQLLNFLPSLGYTKIIFEK